MPGKLHIARYETELGVLTEAETLALLRAGFLQPTDLYWTQGMSDWESLSEFKAESEKAQSPAALMKRAAEKFKSVGEVAVSQATKLTGKLKSMSGDGRLKMSTNQMLSSFAPQIRKLVASQLLKHPVVRVRAAIQDDAFVRRVFDATYDCLPKPIDRFVAEEAFIQFCMERRTVLIAPAPDGRQGDL
jgi:hypothetical protein